MFQSATRFILFMVGVSLTLTTAKVGSIGPIIFTVSRVTVMVLLAWSILIWAIDRRRLPRDRRNAWLVAFAIALLTSSLLAISAGSPAFDTLISAQQIYASMAFAVLLVFALSDRQRLDAFLIGYLVSVVLSALSVLMTGTLGRTGGLGGDANRFAVEAIIGVVIAVLFFYTKPSFLWRVFLAVVVFLALAAIMKSLSRSALVAGVLMFGLWMFRFRRLDMLRYVVPVGVLIGVSLMFVSADWTKRMGTMTTAEGIQKDTSIQSRFQMSAFALRGFASNPVIGIGFRRIGYFAHEHSRYLQHSDPGARSSSHLLRKGTAIHQLYLAVLGEMGLVGAIPFGVLMIMTWKQYNLAARWASQAREDRELRELHLYAVFLQLGFFGLLVAGMFLPELHWKSFWAVLGLSAVVLEATARRVAELQADTQVAEPPDVDGDDSFRVPQLGVPARADPWPEEP